MPIISEDEVKIATNYGKIGLNLYFYFKISSFFIYNLRKSFIFAYLI